MALVGEAFLTATVQVLCDKIASQDFQQFLKKNKLNVQLLEELRTTLLTLEAVLNDAEEQQITNPAVDKWLAELQVAVFDAEDLLDEINYEELKSKVEQDHCKTSGLYNKVSGLLSSAISSYGTNRELNSKIEKIYQRMKQFAAQNDNLGLRRGVTTVSKTKSQRKPTSSVVNEPALYGRDDDKEKLMKMLLSETDQGDQSENKMIQFVTIVGMGGLGKTTLARHLYNDDRIKNNFDVKAWAYVSEVFNIVGVTKTLLDEVNPNNTAKDTLNSLQLELSNAVKGQKFLFVLDDVWDIDYEEWKGLIAPFHASNRGSKVIITTRLALDHIPELSSHSLKPLSHEDCWLLLAKHATVEDKKCNNYVDLERIGRKIAERCDGLPLAALTLGGLLGANLDTEEWSKILKSNIWELKNVNIIPALRLSYHYLPTNLKQCFAYCSIFPKGYLLEKWHLVLVWMGAGLIQLPQNGKTLEDIGEEYFKELLSRSMIQQIRADGKEQFTMHDHLNDLAFLMSKKSGLCLKDRSDITKNIRHISYERTFYDFENKFEILFKFKYLRSFLAIKTIKWNFKSHLTKRVLEDFIPKLRGLRVLSLSSYENIYMLSISIGNLVHLRYLDMSCTFINELPQIICTLYNLQTLLLSNCIYLIELPMEIEKLINLRHLDISGTNLKEMPVQITKLTSLQTLSTFIVSSGLKISELHNFQHLQRKLSILKLENIVKDRDAREANLRDKESIEELVLKWSKDKEENSFHEKQVLENLHPPKNLQKLTIEFYSGTKFPIWLGSSLSRMVSLSISNCHFCTSLPTLGKLPFLEKLFIKRMNYVRDVSIEFYGDFPSSKFQPFQSLKHLEFGEMFDWENWILVEGVASAFPCLESLLLFKCPKLKGELPGNLPCLKKLSIIGCDELELRHSGNLSSLPPWTSTIQEFQLVESSTCIQSLLDTNIGGGESHVSSSLCNLQISKCDTMEFVPKMILNNNNNCLTHLYLYHLPSLLSFPSGGLPTSLQVLKIVSCRKLKFLAQETMYKYKCLDRIDIWYSCDSMTRFPLGSFPMLRKLKLKYCKNLKSLSIDVSKNDGFESLSHLEMLDIWFCDNLEYLIPQDQGLPTPNLTRLVVCDCKNLKSLPEQIHTLTALEHLYMEYHPNLVCNFGEHGLPSNLNYLSIISCEKLLPTIAEWGMENLNHLTEFWIDGERGKILFNT